METNFAKLSPSQVRALPFLAIGMPAREVAKHASVSEQSLSKWKSDENFVLCVEAARAQVSEKTAAQLSALLGCAIATIGEVLAHGNTDSVRLKAAQYVVDKALSMEDNALPMGPGAPLTELDEFEADFERQLWEHAQLRKTAGQIIQILEADESELHKYIGE